MTKFNPVLYTSLKKESFELIIGQIPELSDLLESNQMLSGYLYQEDCFLIQDDERAINNLIKIIFFDELPDNRNILIDFQLPGLYFAKSNYLEVPEYLPSQDITTDQEFSLTDYASFLEK